MKTEQSDVEIIEVSNNGPHWDDFLRCLHEVAPEQAPFVLGEYSANLLCYLFVAMCYGHAVGFLRFGVQEIGPEFGCLTLTVSGNLVTEAKIHAFAVREHYRRQGIGSMLQKHAIEKSRQLGCHQLSSHTSQENGPNVALKLKLGFAAMPDTGGGVMFFLPLRALSTPILSSPANEPSA